MSAEGTNEAGRYARTVALNAASGLVDALTALQDQIGETARAHGFWVNPDDVERKLLLQISEIIEAFNERRNGRDIHDAYYENTPCGPKPCGFAIEIADAIIRMFDMGAQQALDIPAAIIEKMAYNEKRPFRHGKSF